MTEGKELADKELKISIINHISVLEDAKGKHDHDEERYEDFYFKRNQRPRF